MEPTAENAADVARILTAQRDIVRAVQAGQAPAPDVIDRHSLALTDIAGEPERAAIAVAMLGGILLATIDQRAADHGWSPDEYLERILLGNLDGAS